MMITWSANCTIKTSNYYLLPKVQKAADIIPRYACFLHIYKLDPKLVKIFNFSFSQIRTFYYQGSANVS